jgi:acetyltransferase-like isoleucine patch superfamily enzyme
MIKITFCKLIKTMSDLHHVAKLRKRFSSSIIHYGVRVDKNSNLDGLNVLFEDVTLTETKIGMHSYVQKNSVLNNTKVGKFCSIGMNVSIGLAEHSLNTLSTHPAFYLKNSPIVKTFSTENLFLNFKETIFGNDVWIGQGAMLMSGLKIGTGAVVGAGAVVTRDIPDYGIAVGVPARIIRYRFTQEVIDKLLQSKWWDLPDNWLHSNTSSFISPDFFLGRYGEYYSNTQSSNEL